MSHRAMIDGTAYEVTGGKTLVDGTVYSIKGGKTMVDGTVYGIDFGSAEVPVSFDGTHTIYGDGRKGWIEITGAGTLTVNRSIVADIYLLGKGGKGGTVAAKYVQYSTAKTYTTTSGKGGDGGKYLEVYGQTLNGTYEASLNASDGSSSKTTTGDHAKLGNWNSSTGVSAATGAAGTTYSCNVTGGTNASQITVTSTVTPASGGAGRQPFADNNPMSQGNAAKKLGSSGGSGGLRKSHLKVTYIQQEDGSSHTNFATEQTVIVSSGGINGETAGAPGNGSSGGDAHIVNGTYSQSAMNADFSISTNSGNVGIIIVRWGY